MTIHLPTSSFAEMLPTLAEGLFAPLDSRDGGNVIRLSPPVGRGAITGVRFYRGLSLLRWQVALDQEVTMYVAPTDHHPLRLMLCAQGSVYHSVDAHRIRYPLEALGCSLSACSGYVDQHVCLPAHQSLSLYVAEVDRAVYESRAHFPPGDGHHPLTPIFFDTSAPSPFLYRSPYSPLISEALRDLEEAEQYRGLARHTFLEAKALELLSLALQQYAEHQPPPNNSP